MSSSYSWEMFEDTYIPTQSELITAWTHYRLLLLENDPDIPWEGPVERTHQAQETIRKIKEEAWDDGHWFGRKTDEPRDGNPYKEL